MVWFEVAGTCANTQLPLNSRLAQAKIKACSGIWLIRAEERSERLAGSMNFDDTRHSTAAQSNPSTPNPSPFALVVLELERARRGVSDLWCFSPDSLP